MVLAVKGMKFIMISTCISITYLYDFIFIWDHPIGKQFYSYV